MFVLPADSRRDELLARVRAFVGRENGDPAWSGDGAEVKTLVVVHRMSATRMGFAGIYSALNDRAPPAFSDGLLDGSAWPVRQLLSFALPVAEAVGACREFDAMTLLRKHSPALSDPGTSGAPLSRRLRELRAAASRLHALLQSSGGGTVRDVLVLTQEANLVAIDPRVRAHLDGKVPTIVSGSGEDDEASRETASMDAFLACPAAELRGYDTYIRRLSPFATQQGIKGTEYERVLVVLDDEEGTHTQFSYDKYFGVKQPTKTDIENERAGKETATERTRRLFYVCCTRATTDLAVVYYTADPSAAEARMKSMQLFREGAVHNISALP